MVFLQQKPWLNSLCGEEEWEAVVHQRRQEENLHSFRCRGLRIFLARACNSWPSGKKRTDRTTFSHSRDEGEGRRILYPIEAVLT